MTACVLAVFLLGLLDKLPASATDCVINIGSNIDPIIATPPTISIAFEPIVHHMIKAQPNLFVVPAAVSDADGLEMMTVSGRSSVMPGTTSSLASLDTTKKTMHSYRSKLGLQKAGGAVKVVPVLSMRRVLNALPRNLTLAYLRTDMQGFDAVALRSAGQQLLRAEFLAGEFNYQGFSAYTGMTNDLCTMVVDMNKLGFELVGVVNRHLLYNRSVTYHHCGLDVPGGHELDDWPVWGDGSMEVDAFWASPKRTYTHPPVNKKHWPFGHVALPSRVER